MILNDDDGRFPDSITSRTHCNVAAGRRCRREEVTERRFGYLPRGRRGDLVWRRDYRSARNAAMRSSRGGCVISRRRKPDPNPPVMPKAAI